MVLIRVVSVFLFHISMGYGQKIFYAKHLSCIAEQGGSIAGLNAKVNWILKQ
tara:strand:- start:8032 stop:8187 length:156 start_codon:yes stop_codon:yes gene_type:complete